MKGHRTREGDRIRVGATKVIVNAYTVYPATIATGDENGFAIGCPSKSDGLCASEGDALAKRAICGFDEVELVYAGPAADHCESFAIRREGGSLQHVGKQNRCPCWLDFPSRHDTCTAIRELTY